MPKSLSPQGIQFDSPLQRQWMIRSSIGRLALNAATVFGASSSSQRATKRIPAATISSTRETLPGSVGPLMFEAWAPGRLNLIGEHTDYSGGLVLPVAIQLGVTLQAKIGGTSVRLRSEAFGDVADVSLAGEPLGELPRWGRYVAAIVRLVAPEAGLD